MGSNAGGVAFDTLNQLPIWVGWRKGQIENGKERKPPINVMTGARASTGRRSDWTTKVKVEEWAISTPGGGWGVILTSIGDFYLCGIDFDACRDPVTLEVKSFAIEVLERLDSYTEISPSRSGLHTLFLMEPEDYKLACAFMGDDRRGRKFTQGSGEHPPSIEPALTGRYLTVTERVYKDYDTLNVVGADVVRWILDEAGPALARPNGKDHSHDTKKPRDESRSGEAWRETLFRMPYMEYEAFKKVMLEHPDPVIREWANDKGKTRGFWEMKQLWRKAIKPKVRENGIAYEGVLASTITPKPREWLWKGHLLKSALELLTGIPGLGKSQVQIGYIACTTTTKIWPDGAPSGDPANVIMLTAEDALDSEVIPRLMAAGADLERVFILKKIRTDNERRQFLLSDDLDMLRRCIRDFNAALVTLDPITAYMGKIDSHKATDVRGQLGPLKDLAEETGVAFSAITHPPKSSSQRAIDHFIGSQAFVAAARIGHLCIPEVDEDGGVTERVLYAHVKGSSSDKMPTLAYTKNVVTVQKRPFIDSPCVRWDETSVDISADEAISAAVRRERKGKDEKSDPLEPLKDLLSEMLKDGPMLQTDIENRATAHGFTEGQLVRARRALSIEAHKEAKTNGRWWVCLPGQWSKGR